MSLGRAERRELALLLVVLAVAAAVRFWGLDFGLPHRMTRPDEEGLIVPAVRMAVGRLNPHWFHWPSLLMYLLALPYTIYLLWLRTRGAVIPADPVDLYVAHPSTFHLLDRALAASFGVLTVYLLYRLARHFFSERTSISAALFLALTPLHVRDSHFGVTDVPATCLVVAAVYAAAGWLESPTRRRLAVAAACAGLAASTKYNAGFVIVAILAAIGIRAFDEHMTSPRGLIAIVAVVATGAFVIGTPFSVLAPGEFIAGVKEVSVHLASGHGQDLGLGWWYHLQMTLRHGVGLPMLVVGLAGLVWLAIERPRPALLLLTFPVVYYAVSGGSRLVFFRYALPMTPFVCLTAAYLVGRLPRSVGVAAGLAIALAGVPDIVRLNLALTKTDTRVLAGEWIRSRFPHGATFYASGAFYGHVELDAPRFGPRRLAQEPEILIIQSSPLMYSNDGPEVAENATRDYTRIAAFDAYDPALVDRNVYDRLDAFYLPLRGLHGIERPGPTITVWQRRRGAAMASAAGRR